MALKELEKIENVYSTYTEKCSNTNVNKDDKYKDYSSWEDFYFSEKERFSTEFEEDDYFDDNPDDYYDLGNDDSLSERKKTCSFYDIIRDGNIFKDVDQIDMSSLNISDLEGIDDFVYSLSDNKITDVSELMGLNRLEELSLNQNQIGYIDRLCNLNSLKFLDLSDNDINDISALFELDNLQFVNIVNNPVPKNQIEELLDKKGIVVY